MTQPRAPKRGMLETAKALGKGFWGGVKTIGKGFLGGVRGCIGGAVVGAISGIARIFKAVGQIAKDSDSNDPKVKRRADAAMAALILLPVALLPFVGVLGVGAIALFTAGAVASVNAIYGAIRGAYEGAKGEPFGKSMEKMFDEALPEPARSSIHENSNELDSKIELRTTYDNKPAADLDNQNSDFASVVPDTPPASKKKQLHINPEEPVFENPYDQHVERLERKSSTPLPIAYEPSPTASELSLRVESKEHKSSSSSNVSSPASVHVKTDRTATFAPFFSSSQERNAYTFTSQEISKSWKKVDETPVNDSKSLKDAPPIKFEYVAADNKSVEKKEISIYQSKIATEVANDQGTFEAMLMMWKEKHPHKPPKLSTHSGAEASWKAAFANVYPQVVLTSDILKIRDKQQPTPDPVASRRLSS